VLPIATREQWESDVDFLKTVLRREETLRMCPAQQDLFSQVQDRMDMDWIDLADALQKRVVREFGDGGDADYALHMLRTAASRFPDDAEMAAISVYRRENTVRRGSLRVGDVLPDAALVNLSTGEACSLHGQVESSEKPLVIIAGSWT
jgi:hypothetical protein